MDPQHSSAPAARWRHQVSQGGSVALTASLDIIDKIKHVGLVKWGWNAHTNTHTNTQTHKHTFVCVHHATLIEKCT